MEGWKRIKQLLREPTYRTRLAVFMLLGLVFTLLAIVIRHAFWRNLLLEFAVVFNAVALIQFLWDFLGGDPMELRIRDVQTEIASSRQSVEDQLSNAMSDFDKELSSLKHSMNLLSDLIDGNIGIERIWPNRRAWQIDSTDGLRAWQKRICQADHVEILSNTLWNNWMHQEEFRRELFANVARGASARILIYDPDPHSDPEKPTPLELRAADEQDTPGEMQQEIKSTLRWLAEGWASLDTSARKNLEVRLVWHSLIYAQILRADELMLVAIYLSGKSGGPSPTMQLRGMQSAYFTRYAEQFEIHWSRGKALGDDELRRRLEEYRTLHPAPVEK